MNSLRGHKDKKDFIQAWMAFEKLMAIWNFQNDEAFFKVKGNIHLFFKADFILDRLNGGEGFSFSMQRLRPPSFWICTGR